MILFHYKLIHYLSNNILIDLYNSINAPYVDNYSNNDLIRYTRYIIAEIKFRQLNVNIQSIPKASSDDNQKKSVNTSVFYKHHTLRYMIQCYFYLEMMYQLHETDYTEEQFDELKQFVRNNLEHELF